MVKQNQFWWLGDAYWERTMVQQDIVMVIFLRYSTYFLLLLLYVHECTTICTWQVNWKHKALGPMRFGFGRPRWASRGGPGNSLEGHLVPNKPPKRVFLLFPPPPPSTLQFCGLPILLRLVKSSKRGPGVFPHSKQVSVVKEVPSPKLDLQKKYPKVALMQLDTCFFMFHTSPRLHPGQHC